MKRVLDYNITSSNILSTFFSVVDTPENTKHDVYDTIICFRDGIQHEFDNILKYTHENTKIVVDIVSESGCIDDFLQFFHNFTQRHSNTSFYLIVDSEFEHKFGANVKVCSSFKLSPLVFFENHSYVPHNQQYTIGFPEIYDKNSEFSCLNGRLRSHRILLLLELIKRGIIDLTHQHQNNQISFLFYSNESTDYEMYVEMVNNLGLSSEDVKLLLNVKNSLPIKIRSEDGTPPGTFLQNESFRTILNLVTENVAGIDCEITDINTITFTEKAWIPFRIHQMPIYISVPGYVEQLRKLGFDLFDDVIDHSYDKEPDVVKRIKMAVDQLEIVSKIDLLDFYNKNYKRFVKNNINCESLKMEGYFILRDFILENDLL